MVGRRSDSGRAVAPAGVVLLEREVALRSLTTALRGAGNRAGRLVLLSGEAGGGKTSVIRRFATLAQASARVMVGACEPLSSPRPLAPLLDVVPSMGVAVAQTLSRVRDGAPASELFDSVLAELDSHHRDSVLVFEDLHWADEATLDLVRYLARRLATVRALLVVTYRDDELGRTHPLSVLLGDLAPMPGIQRISLDRLSRTAVAELAAGHHVDSDRLHQITGGNPFFITEVLAAAPGAIPLSVRAAVRGRLARLSEPGVAVVEALAVLGTSARPEVVGDLVGDAQEGLRDAGERGLLTVNASVVAFRHELARMAVLDTVPSFRRVLLHRSVLTTLLKNEPDDDQLALVVEHAVHAGDDAAVLTYAPLAGQRAGALGAHREAAAHYGRAIALVDALPLPEQVALLQAASFEYYANADLAAITDCCVRLLQLQRQIGDQRAVGDSMRWLSLLRWSAGLARESLRLAKESVRVLEAMRPGPELVFSYAHLVELSFYIHDVRSAHRYAELGSALARRLERPDLELRVRYFAIAARMLDSDDGWDELDEIREAAVAGGFLEHIFMMTVVPPGFAASRHDPIRALALVDRAAVLMVERSGWAVRLVAGGFRAHALMQCGQWTAAEKQASEILASSRGAPLSRIPPMSVLGLLRARRAGTDVWPILDQALATGDGPGLLPMGLLFEARAEAAWLAGDDEHAIAEAQRGLAGPSPTADPWQAGALACWIFRAGGRPPSVPTAEPYAREIAGDWAGAATAYEARGLPYEAAIARLGGDADAVRAALRTFTQLGAQPAAARARTRLRALGERRGTRTPWTVNRDNPYGLTSRQLQVHALLADGLTNAQIAAELVLSRNTVNHHVTAILTKLDVPNRTEAARKLDRPDQR